MVEQVRGHQDGKVERREIVMYISHATHDKEGEIMQGPTKERDLAYIQKVFPFSWLHVDVPPLHAEHVHPKREHAKHEADGGAPPDDGRADEIVLGLLVAPAAHAQAEPHQRPIRRLGREDVLFVRVRDERVVRRHHRDVQMPKVAQEWRAVELDLARW